MLHEITINNFKSISELRIELGRVNIFIGENGCGKSNILEALAMMGAALLNKLDSEELFARGIRASRPSLTMSSFAKEEAKKEIIFEGGISATEKIERTVVRMVPSEAPSGNWNVGKITIDLGFDDTEAKKRANVKRAVENTWDIVLKMVKDQSVSEEQAKSLSLALLNSLSTEERPHFIALLTDSMEKARVRNAVRDLLGNFVIYSANSLALRGLTSISRKEPLGINGENLDVAIASLDAATTAQILARCRLVPWVNKIFIDDGDHLKFAKYKLGRSSSRLYFRDRFMRQRNNIFSAENANEGILHVLFYLTILLSPDAPKVFGIDNIESGLNPAMCRDLIVQLVEIATQNDKQVLITTHNPAVLDGLNLHDPSQRLFVVSRDDAGHTVAERIRLKPPAGEDEPRFKLSELWMRGRLGGLPKGF